MTNKNQDLDNWRYINLYPYNERWILEEEIRESKQESKQRQQEKDWQKLIIVSD